MIYGPRWDSELGKALRKNDAGDVYPFIRSLREADGVSQTEFAERLGISRANLCDIEKGRKPASIARAAKLAKKLKIAQKVMVQLAIQDEVQRAGCR
jgi:transcriptional regulator with XRE-family HTH domain